MYKIKARTAWDYVEIGPLSSFEAAVNYLYDGRELEEKAMYYKTKRQALEDKEHPLIKEILSTVMEGG